MSIEEIDMQISRIIHQLDWDNAEEIEDIPEITSGRRHQFKPWLDNWELIHATPPFLRQRMFTVNENGNYNLST